MINYQPSENLNNPNTRVFITDVELNNGLKTNIITIFDNSDVRFEDIYIGIRKSLEFTSTTKTMHSKLFSIENSILVESGIKYQKEKILNQNINFRV